MPCVAPKSRFVLAPKYLRLMSKRNSRQLSSSGAPCPCAPHCSCRLFKLLHVSHPIEKKLPSDRSAGGHFLLSTERSVDWPSRYALGIQRFVARDESLSCWRPQTATHSGPESDSAYMSVTVTRWTDTTGTYWSAVRTEGYRVYS